jgi:CRP-like cAMP-binding protein
MKSQLALYIQNEVDIDEEDLQTVLARFHVLKAKRSDVLLNEGEMNNRIIFVNKGCLRIYFIQEDGQEATRYLAFEDQFATALVSFISRSPSLEFIQAVEASELLTVNHTDFAYLLREVPIWEQFYRKYLEKAYVTNTNRLMSFITMDAGSRYEELLLQHPETIQRLPNKLVASYLNISQETLSRIKARK